MHRCEHLLLRLRMLRWRAFMRSCLGYSHRSRIGFSVSLLLVCLTTLGSVWRERTWLVPRIDHQAGAACILAAACLLSKGMVSGRRAAGSARRDMAAPWLTILPWPDRRRKRALLLSCLPPLGLELAQAFAAALLAGVLIRPAAIPLLCLAGAALSGSGFAGGAAIGPARVRAAGRPAGTAARPSTPLARADQGRPRWLGTWAMDGRSRRLVQLWLGLLASIGLLGGAGSLGTGTAAPGVLTAIIGGHLVFLAALRARPLRADALRLLPASFRRAAWGVLRLPLLLSLGWILLPEAAAFAAAPGDPAPVGGLCGVLLLDALAGLSTLWLANAPAAALLLHGVILLLGLQYWARLGLSEIAVLIGLAGLLWRGARRRFVEGSHRARRHP